MPHQCRYACELSALIVSLSIMNRALNHLEIEWHSITMYICHPMYSWKQIFSPPFKAWTEHHSSHIRGSYSLASAACVVDIPSCFYNFVYNFVYTFIPLSFLSKITSNLLPGLHHILLPVHLYISLLFVIRFSETKYVYQQNYESRTLTVRMRVCRKSDIHCATIWP